jgi:basic amino acid/polyamine antiporter, APA family
LADQKKNFVREATGLVRAVSPWNAFWYNLWNGGGYWAPVFFLGLLPIVLPQANIIIALLIVGAWSTVIGALYMLGLFAAPRSPSDYVFVSRTLGPAIGLGFSVLLVVWISLLNATGIFTMFGAISDGVFSIGAMTHNTGLITAWSSIVGNQAEEWALGVFIYAVAALLVFIGLRRYMRIFNTFVTGLTFVAIAIIVFTVLTTTSADFIARFNTDVAPISGNSTSYQQLYSLATSQGYAPATGINWSQTLAASVVWWLFPMFGMPSAEFGGEIKQATNKKIQFMVMSGGQWVTCLMGAILIWFFLRNIPLNWIGAIGYLSLAAPSSLPSWLAATAPASPYWTIPFISFLINNPILSSIVVFAYIVGALAFTVPPIVSASRHLFAWSFDRIIPSQFANVSPRLQSPVVSVLAIGIVAIIGWTLGLYTSFITIAEGSSMGIAIAFMIVAIAGIVFMYRKKEMYELSGLKSLKIGGLGIFPLVGVASLALLLAVVYQFFNSLSFLINGSGLQVVEYSLAFFLIGAVGFYASKAIQARRGIMIDMAFKEIPPE